MTGKNCTKQHKMSKKTIYFSTYKISNKEPGHRNFSEKTETQMEVRPKGYTS